MQQLLNSMSPEQRAQLQGLAESLLEDLDLRWQVDELARNLQKAFPNMPWNRSMSFSGDDPLQLGQIPGLLDMLGNIDDLEHLLQSATQPGELAEVDIDQARDLLGDDAARSLERLRELARMLEEAGLIEQREGRLELTPKGIRAIGNKALGDLYRKLLKDRGRPPRDRALRCRQRARLRAQALRVRRSVPPQRRGDRQERHLAPGRRNARAPRTDRLRGRTHRAAQPLVDRAAPGRVALDADARQLLVGQEGRHGAARARSRPSSRGTTSGWSSFGRVAREVKPELLPEMSWDFEWGTNMQHAMMLARRQLAPRGRDQADDHGHRRRAHCPHRGGRGLLPVPAVTGDDRGDAQGGDAVHPGGHPHQYLHARRELLPP